MNAAHIQPRAQLWAGLALLLLVLQLIIPNRIWEALLAGMGSAWVLAFFWARALSRNLRFYREMRYGWAHVGDSLEERFTLVNTGLIPAFWVEITDRSTLPDYHINQVTAIGSNDRYTWKTRQTCTRRGLYTLGPTLLQASDPLGLFSISIELPGTATLLVLPPILPLPAIEVAPAGRAGDGRRSRADPLERTISARSVRPYQPGDPLRWIHWPLSAHHQELYVRLLDSTPASDWWIFLDLDRSVQTGAGWSSTEEHGVILAASLADRGLRTGHAVGLAIAGESLVWLLPKNVPEQRMQILRALALAKGSDTPLAQLLQAARPELRRGTSLILITPSVDASWVQALSLLARERLTPTVLLFDAPSYGVSREMRPIQALLARLGIATYPIRRELLDRQEAHPGHQGEWEWRVTALGRAIPVRKPADLSWRKVGE